MAAAIAALVLAVIGLLDSAYMTLAYYGRVRRDPRLVPSVATSDEGTCRTVVGTPEARVLGLPNSLLGIAYYLMVIAAAAARVAVGSWPFLPALVAASVAAAVFSVYLAWALIFRLRVACPLCFLAQATNIALAAILASAV